MLEYALSKAYQALFTFLTVKLGIITFLFPIENTERNGFLQKLSVLFYMNILFFIIKQFYSIVKISNCLAALTSTLEGCKSFLSNTSEKVSKAKSCVFASSLK